MRPSSAFLGILTNNRISATVWKQCGVFDSNIKRINKKTAQLARYVRRGLLDGRDINLKGLPVPKAKGPVRAKASILNSGPFIR